MHTHTERERERERERDSRTLVFQARRRLSPDTTDMAEDTILPVNY